MLAKSLSAMALACGLAAVLFVTARAQDAFVGSWVLDPSASTAAPGMMPTSSVVQITDAGGGKYTSASEATLSGVTARTATTYSIDGKDYTVTTEPAQPGAPQITQSISRVSDTAYETSLKMGGQEIATALSEVSGDGKTMTVTTTGIGQFAVVSSKMVYRRQ